MTLIDAPRGPYKLVTVNTAPERAKRLIGRVADDLKDRYEIQHIANCEKIEEVEAAVAQYQPEVLFCASMWDSEQAAEIQTIARKIKPDIAMYAIPHGLQLEKGPDAIVEHLNSMRTPNLTVPKWRRALTVEEQDDAPQGPTLLSNGPSSIEVHDRWTTDVIKQCERQGIKYIIPTNKASRVWKAKINELSNRSLFPNTKSTYMRGSDPKKAFEQTCYSGGLYPYGKDIRAVLPGLEDFDVVKVAAA